MKVEVGQNYKVKNCDYAFEVVAIDNRNTVWGLASGVMLSRYHSEIISEWKDSPCSKCKDEPDPGEGWRLLEPHEDVEEGDEYYSPANNVWSKPAKSRYGGKLPIKGKFTYRRRTTPQYVPYTWDDREELRGRWYRRKDNGREVMVCCCYERGSDFCINSYSPEKFLELCEWLDGSPCGKKV